MRYPISFLVGMSLAACSTVESLDAHEDALAFSQGGMTVTSQCVQQTHLSSNGCQTVAELELVAQSACSGMQMVLARSAVSGSCTNASGAAGFEQIDYACCPSPAANPGGGASNPPTQANPGGNTNPAAPAPAACIVDILDPNQCVEEALMKTKAEAICASHQMQLVNHAFATCTAAGAAPGNASLMKYACCPSGAPQPAPAPTVPAPPSACQDINVGLPPVNMQSTHPQVLAGTCAEISDIKMHAAQRCATLGLPNMTAFTPLSSTACQDPLAMGALATCCN